MNDFITVYFVNEYEPRDSELDLFEQLIGREIARGSGFINVYTTDVKLVQTLVTVIGPARITEVAYDAVS